MIRVTLTGTTPEDAQCGHGPGDTIRGSSVAFKFN
eukprot:CAMPEP_0196727616 /NCGR_PEP_ID=MMETSP1091-20130531/8563_1 /TAXON_ID=302021 /ORGANISM="Rhodomonas sp., Strain CCMP768" /LENGTH=34 /DNA_ID= /DNA_START= /DNA_END= /DNA_ORIENTATION=